MATFRNRCRPDRAGRQAARDRRADEVLPHHHRRLLARELRIGCGLQQRQRQHGQGNALEVAGQVLARPAVDQRW
jgi:hypothetical protein